VLTELLGRGGMGVVYRGEREQGGFAQSVAIKLLRTGAHDDPLPRNASRANARSWCACSIRNIARLLDGGIADDGQPWYAMELRARRALLDGRRARRRIAASAPAALLMQVCDAVQLRAPEPGAASRPEAGQHPRRRERAR
jgi:serine/threonine protein kinase